MKIIKASSSLEGSTCAAAAVAIDSTAAAGWPGGRLPWVAKQLAA